MFAISVAAELSSLHPQTLRIYEREGLVEPGRSAGGTRLYSGDDLTRLREIATLIDDGLNIAGIKRVLQLQDEVRRLQAEMERLSAASFENVHLDTSICCMPGMLPDCYCTAMTMLSCSG